MEKLLIANLTPANERKLTQLAQAKKIKVQVIDTTMHSLTIDEILNLQDDKSTSIHSTEDGAFDESLVIFCNLSEKHFDKLLFEMRTSRLKIDYKAVLTKTNRFWRLKDLLNELQNERRQIASQIRKEQ